jgi:hypothetical protein
VWEGRHGVLGPSIINSCFTVSLSYPFVDTHNIPLWTPIISLWGHPDPFGTPRSLWDTHNIPLGHPLYGLGDTHKYAIGGSSPLGTPEEICLEGYPAPSGNYGYAFGDIRCVWGHPLKGSSGGHPETHENDLFLTSHVERRRSKVEAYWLLATDNCFFGTVPHAPYGAPCDAQKCRAGRKASREVPKFGTTDALPGVPTKVVIFEAVYLFPPLNSR